MPVEQPPEVEFATEDGIFIKQMYLRKAGTAVPQHSHVYDHTSMLAVGAVALYRNGVFQGNLEAPKPITIKAGMKHTFISLVDHTLIYCIHNISRTGEVEVAEEHIIGEKSCLGVQLLVP